MVYERVETHACTEGLTVIYIKLLPAAVVCGYDLQLVTERRRWRQKCNPVGVVAL
jgi:hypothetical protein